MRGPQWNRTIFAGFSVRCIYHVCQRPKTRPETIPGMKRRDGIIAGLTAGNDKHNKYKTTMTDYSEASATFSI